MPENQKAWNSNNQGVKETFTQTSRSSRDGRCAAEQRGHTTRPDLAGKVGLVEQETKDSKLAINYCGGLDGGRNS